MSGLFDSIVRSDLTPKLRSEGIFAYWNRSACSGPGAVRKLLNLWFSHLTTSEQNALQSRFRATDNAISSAFHELCLYEILFQGKCNITFHPSMNGTATHPDYRVCQSDGTEFLLEAVSATTASTGPTDSPRRNRIRDALRGFRYPGFKFGIGELTEGNQDLRWKSVELHIKNELGRITVRSGPIALPAFESSDGWKIRLQAIPVSCPEDSGGILYEGWSGTYIGPREALTRALKKKSGKYGKPDRPYVIAVNSLDVMCSARDFDTTLFGDPSRTGDSGFWGTAENPNNTRVSAVLFTINLWPETILMGQVGACLYLNPWAKRPFAGLFTKLETVQWNNGRFDRRSGIPLQELTGVDMPITISD